MENWIDICGYEGKYQISDLGRVRSVPGTYLRAGIEVKRKGKILKQQETGKGYLRVTFGEGGEKKTYQVHRLVAKAFIPKIEGKEQINHIDGDKRNNSANNLEWVTCKENMRHAKENGLRPDFSTFDWGSPKVAVAKCDLETGEVIEIYKSVTRAAYANGLRRSNISKVIHGERKNCGGFSWVAM